jgi:hypothetical protein
VPRRSYGPLPSPLQVNHEEILDEEAFDSTYLVKAWSFDSDSYRALKSKIYTHDTYLGTQSKSEEDYTWPGAILR